MPDLMRKCGLAKERALSDGRLAEVLADARDSRGMIPLRRAVGALEGARKSPFRKADQASCERFVKFASVWT